MLTLQTQLTMIADSFYIPKNNPAKPRGEDAHFICPQAHVIGIADGVGGWARHGIDAGEYARELMRNAADSAKNSGPAAVDPKSVLAAAFTKTAKPGSSTACVISLAGNRLRAANVGDSGFAVIRGGRTIYRSPAQQYRFNAPYQLGPASPECLETAAEMAVEVEGGDVVVAGTDGLFDNVFPEEVDATVERCFSGGMAPAAVARELAAAARGKSLERNTPSPFEVAAYEAGVVHFGGKEDDITVVVAYVIPWGIILDYCVNLMRAQSNLALVMERDDNGDGDEREQNSENLRMEIAETTTTPKANKGGKRWKKMAEKRSSNNAEINDEENNLRIQEEGNQCRKRGLKQLQGEEGIEGNKVRKIIETMRVDDSYSLCT